MTGEGAKQYFHIMMSAIKTKKQESKEVEDDGQGPSWEDSSEAKT